MLPKPNSLLGLPRAGLAYVRAGVAMGTLKLMGRHYNFVDGKFELWGYTILKIHPVLLYRLATSILKLYRFAILKLKLVLYDTCR